MKPLSHMLILLPRSISFAIFHFHLSDVCTTGSLSIASINRMCIMQRNVLRIICFLKFNNHTIQLFCKMKLIYSNYIIMISLFCLNWPRIGFYKSIYKIELFFLPKLTFQHHLHKTVLGQLPPPPSNCPPDNCSQTMAPQKNCPRAIGAWIITSWIITPGQLPSK